MIELTHDEKLGEAGAAGTALCGAQARPRPSEALQLAWVSASASSSSRLAVHAALRCWLLALLVVRMPSMGSSRAELCYAVLGMSSQAHRGVQSQCVRACLLPLPLPR